MAADGTVNIDVELNSDQAIAERNKLNDSFKTIGEGAGDKIAPSIKSGLDKAANDADTTHQKIKDTLEKPIHTKMDADTSEAHAKARQLGESYRDIPKEVRTHLIAEARDHGISNMDRLLRKMPKETRTELIAKANRGEVIDYDKLLEKLPAKLVTEVRLNNKASLPMKEIQEQANATGHSFSHLKEIMMGTFAGQWLMNGLGALKNGLLAAAQAGMQYNIAQDRMKTVWTALTTEAPRDGRELVKYINDVSQHSIYAADTVDRMAQSFYHVHSSVRETKQWTNDFVRLGSTLHMNNETVGRALNDIARMGGSAEAPTPLGSQLTVLVGHAPVSTMLDYAAEVRNYTHGQGQLSLVVDGYRPCHNASQVVAAAHYDPCADLPNTPDSIFCAHGAKYSVKWNDVPATMHQPYYCQRQN